MDNSIELEKAENVSNLNKVRKLSKKGYELLKSNNYESAKKVFLEGLDVQEDNSYILVGLGETYRKQKQFSKSIEYYEKVLENDSKNKYALLGIGDSFRGLKKRKKALEVWLKYLELYPNDASISTRVGDIYRNFEDYENSIKFYNKALEVEPNYKFTLMGLGDIYYKTKEYDKALPYFEKLVKQNDGLINILTMIGNIYRKKSDFSKALEYFEKAYKVDNLNPFAIFGLADSLRGLKRYEESINYWLQFENLGQKDSKVLTRIGDCYLNIGMIDKAYDYYSKVSEQKWNKFSLYGLARIDKTKGKYGDAIKKYKKILEVEPDDERTIVLMYRTYVSLDEKEKAVEFLKEKGREDIMRNEDFVSTDKEMVTDD